MAHKKKKLTIPQINAIIKNAGYEWKAGTTAVSQLSEEKQDIRLGLMIDEADMQRIKLALSEKPVKAFKFASKIDWREKDGKNWVTPIKDQGGCGSCVAFGVISALESQGKIEQRNSSWELNLSEADLFYCGAGRKCKEGWWPTNALEYVRNEGVCDEKCFPYKDVNMACKYSCDKEKSMLQVKKWHEIISSDERKEWLDTHGPMVACMAVYRDFFSYKGGVYRHATGDLAGYHAVTCIGYNDDDEYWICKNSWGSEWGENGFFKIAYGEAGMDTDFAKYGVESIYGTLLPDEENNAWAEYIVTDNTFLKDQRVLWVYAKNNWLYKMLSRTELTEMNDLLQESVAVKVWYKDEKITRIQGWRKFSKLTAEKELYSKQDEELVLQ